MNVNAILVKVSIGIFPNTRNDRVITDEVKAKKSLGDGAGKWVKYKLPDEALDPIRKFCGEVRQYHYLHTSPWEDGLRLLNKGISEKYDTKFAEFKAEFGKLVDAFGEQYANWIELAKVMHGSTYEPSDYPSWAQCKAMFHMDCEHTPVPQAKHFDASLQKLYGDALEALTAKKVADAQADAWERLLKPVLAMAEKLSNPDTVFRDTLVDNVKEITGVIPSLNIMGDPALKQAAAEIEKTLANFQPDLLREDKVVRKDVAEKAKMLAERFGALGARKFAA